MEEVSTIPFEEILRISPEEFVNDRDLQRDVHYTVRNSTRDEEFVNGEDRLYNPNPVLEIEGEGRVSWERNTFSLDDKKNTYFFREGHPAEDVPDFLREEDIMPSGFQTIGYGNADEVIEELELEGEDKLRWRAYHMDDEVLSRLNHPDIMFNKPVHRVSNLGGKPELYNSRDGQWQTDDRFYAEDQSYNPSIGKRLAQRLEWLSS